MSRLVVPILLLAASACGRSFGVPFPTNGTSPAPGTTAQDGGGEGNVDDEGNVDAAEGSADEGKWDDEAEGGVDGADWGDAGDTPPDGGDWDAGEGEADVTDGGWGGDVDVCRYYGNPNAEGCCPDETPVELMQVPGAFCSPACFDDASCPDSPYDARCIVALDGGGEGTGCALVCFGIGGPDGCPGGSICNPVQGQNFGICTFP